MKKLYTLIAFLFLIPLQACALEQWTEGEHYKVIADKATEKAEVLEFFSYWCPHCFNFEPLVDQMKDKLAKEVSFTKVHVNFMGSTGPDVQNDASRGLMVARALKREKALNNAVFSYIHKQRAAITGLNDIKNIFVINNVDAAEFDKLANSFGINNMLQKNNKTINQYRKHLRGVPSFIVNGKFQAIFTRDMTPDDMVNLIVWLSKQK